MISRTSKIYAVLLATFLLIGINTPVNFIYWMCAAMGSLLLTSLSLALFSIGSVKVMRTHPETVFQGDTADIALTLYNESPFMKLFLLAEDDCIPFKQGEKNLVNAFLLPFFRKNHPVSFRYALTFSRRGVYTLGPCKVSSGWPLGLFLREKELSQTSVIYALPGAVPIGDFYISGSGEQIHSGMESSTKTGPGTNIYGTREYRPGDSLNHIHWKSTAKKQTLIMKEFEGTGFSVPLLLLDLQAGTDSMNENGESTLETAVTLCASLAKFFFEKRQPFLFTAQGKNRFYCSVDADPADYLKLLKALAEAQCDGQAGFQDFVMDALSPFRGNVCPILISASKIFWTGSLSAFTQISQMNMRPCAMIIDAERFTEKKESAMKPSPFELSHSTLKQNGFQSYTISNHTPLQQALSGEPISS